MAQYINLAGWVGGLEATLFGVTKVEHEDIMHTNLSRCVASATPIAASMSTSFRNSVLCVLLIAFENSPLYLYAGWHEPIANHSKHARF